MFDATVELLLDGVWTDVSEDVRQADGIQITRGRSGEASQADPASCSLTLNNRMGKFSPRNPVGAYYGALGRNTQIRVSVASGARFYGEVSAWPQRWDKTGRDVWTPIQAFGVLRRLGQGSTALRSTLYRALTTRDDVVAYWPCEDVEGSTELASGLPGHPAMTLGGPVDAASFDGFVASSPLPVASSVEWIGAVPTYQVTGLTQANFLLAIPAGGISVISAICHLRTSGNSQLWTVHANTAGDLRLQAFNPAGVQIADSGFVAFGVNGKLLRVSVELDSTTADVDWTLATLEVGSSSGLAVSGTLLARTVGRIKWVAMNPRVGAVPLLSDVAMGHISVHNDITSIYSLGDELNAYTGEHAASRVQRLCSEEGVSVSILVANGVTETARMGAQAPAPLLDLLAEAAEADMGVLFERRDLFGLRYRTRASMYAQSAALTLDYTAGTVANIEPTEDDDGIQNDVTVTRVNGSSARAQLQTGPLSVSAPPDGVGQYAEDVSVSLYSDADLPDQASWRLHMGTVDEARYPVVGVNLANGAFTGNAALTADAADLDVGELLVVTGAPSGMTSPEDIQQIAQGFTETITPFEWLIDVNCTPASPWDVGRWDDSVGPGEARYSTDGTTTTEALDATETGIDVSTPAGPVWGTTDLPYDITIGGERMTVTAVSGTGAAQVFTVTRSVNGVVKAHASGADVQLSKPAVYAL